MSMNKAGPTCTFTQSCPDLQLIWLGFFIQTVGINGPFTISWLLQQQAHLHNQYKIGLFNWAQGAEVHQVALLVRQGKNKQKQGGYTPVRKANSQVSLCFWLGVVKNTLHIVPRDNRKKEMLPYTLHTTCTPVSDVQPQNVNSTLQNVELQKLQTKHFMTNHRKHQQGTPSSLYKQVRSLKVQRQCCLSDVSFWSHSSGLNLISAELTLYYSFVEDTAEYLYLCMIWHFFSLVSNLRRFLMFCGIFPVTLQLGKGEIIWRLHYMCCFQAVQLQQSPIPPVGHTLIEGWPKPSWVPKPSHFRFLDLD